MLERTGKNQNKLCGNAEPKQVTLPHKALLHVNSKAQRYCRADRTGTSSGLPPSIPDIHILEGSTFFMSTSQPQTKGRCGFCAERCKSYVTFEARDEGGKFHETPCCAQRWRSRENTDICRICKTNKILLSSTVDAYDRRRRSWSPLI